jgi:hypothetical protein
MLVTKSNTKKKRREPAALPQKIEDREKLFGNTEPLPRKKNRPVTGDIPITSRRTGLSTSKEKVQPKKPKNVVKKGHHKMPSMSKSNVVKTHNKGSSCMPDSRQLKSKIDRPVPKHKSQDDIPS